MKKKKSNLPAIRGRVGTLLMLVIFGEKASWVTWLAIALAIFGVAKLSLKEDGLAFDPLGMVIVMLSAVGYAS